MSRIFVRNLYDNRWLDFCKHTVRVRSPDNRSWINIDPRKLKVRDGANSEFLAVDCSFDVRFDDLCHNKLINSVNCPPGIPADEAGSGDGRGSSGAEFDLADGYPAGYDLPDAGESGFGVERAQESKHGYAIKRPALNFALESYDDSGIAPSYGRGTYANPNYLGSSIFGDGSIITESVFDVGNIPGYFEVLFASFDDEGISVDVYYLGNRVATTCGFVPGLSKIEFYLDPAIGEGESRIMIRVRSREASRWVYQFVGAKRNLSVFDLDPTDINQFQFLYNTEYIGTPVFPAPCHATVFPNEPRLVDGKWFYEFFHYTESLDDDINWDMVLDYTSWLNADKFEVYHGGERIASTMDSVNDLGMLKFRWNPRRYAKPVTMLMVRVTSNDRIQFDDMQSWYYTLFCPNSPGYRALPWRCGLPIQGINSMGHNSTEDNFDLDNGVDPGIVSIKVIGHEDFEYTVSVFDSEMDIIEVKKGSRLTYVQFFVNRELHGDTRKRIAVRIDAPIGSGWTYYVGCPIPVLDVEIDDKIVPVCEGEIELAINDIGVVKGTQAKFTVTSNVPSASPITINYSTQDGSATATGITYTGLPDVYGIENAARDAATFAVHELSTGLAVIDASWYRLANNDKRVGLNSNINQNVVTSTYQNLSPDAKLLVNAWRRRISNLNGKRWLILTTSANNWAVLCSNVIDSLRSIYGLTATVVLDDYSNVVATDYDIITLANTDAYSRAANAEGKDYLTETFTNKWFSDLASRILNHALYGKILHGVLFAGTSLQSTQYANGLLQEVLNKGSSIKISFDSSKSQNRNIAQYYVADHLVSYPDSPLVSDIDPESVWDGDSTQVMLNYSKPTASFPPDYEATTGTVVLEAGKTSAEILIQTKDHLEDNTGKFFFVNMTDSDIGDIAKPKGTAKFVASSGSSTTDFNFTKSTFDAASFNTFNNMMRGYGSSIVLGIGYAQVTDGKGSLSIPQAGKVAYCEVDNGDAADLRVRSVHGVCAEYPTDPALTYQYKWEVYEVFNTINDEGAVAKVLLVSTDYSNLNSIMKISIPAGHKCDPTNTLRSTWTVVAYIKASNGKVYRSQDLSLSLISNSSSYT